MNSYDRFMKVFLAGLAAPGRNEQSWHVWSLSAIHNIPENHVVELLTEWAQQRLIDIKAYDGTRVKSWREWDELNDLFHNRTDHGYIKISLLAAGGAFVEDAPPDRRIGFVHV